MKSITRRALLTILAGFSFFNPAAVLSAKEKELAIFYSFSGNSKRVTEIFQKLEHFGEQALVPLYVEVDDGLRLSRALERERGQKEERTSSHLTVEHRFGQLPKDRPDFSCLGVHAGFADAKLPEETFTKQRSGNYFRRCRTARRNV